jgi:hypothetical protein
MATATIDAATAARIRRLMDAYPKATVARRVLVTKWNEKIDQARADGREATATGLEFAWSDQVAESRTYRRADRIRETLARLVYLVTGTEPPDFHKVDVLEVPAVVLRVDDHLVIVATGEDCSNVFGGLTVTVVNVADVPTLETEPTR